MTSSLRAEFLLPTLLLVAAGCSSSDGSPASTGSPSSTRSDAGGGGSTTDAGDGRPMPTLPAPPATCPQFVNADTLSPNGGMVNVLGTDVLVWAGEKQDGVKGPLLLYWHGTGSVAQEIQAFMTPQIAEIQSQGGLVASFTTTIAGADGHTTGNNVWYTEDYQSADVIVACAVQQLAIDVRQIYAAGCSAGGLESGSMVPNRPDYLAAAMTNSGGIGLNAPFQPGARIPALITTHGSFAGDFVILHFADVSKSSDQTIANMGGFAVDCDHGGTHCGAPQDVTNAQWQFLKDHPFGTVVDPYAGGLPSTFPSSCTPYQAQ